MNIEKIKIRRSRRLKNHSLTLFCIIMTVIILFLLGSILWVLIVRGLSYLNYTIFTKITPPPGLIGGLKNAILGSLWMVLIAMVIATPLGILTATFLVDFGQKNKFTKVVRLMNDILLSTPSIIIGLFIYLLCVIPMGHFSGLAGALALALIALPMIVRASEDVLYLVSPLLKEAGLALGIPQWRVIVQLSYRVARDGLITAILLALARISGETAPLLFTALNNNFETIHLSQPVASLPIVIYQFALSPYENWQHLAWAGALLMTLAILALNLIARFINTRHALHKI